MSNRYNLLNYIQTRPIEFTVRLLVLVLYFVTMTGLIVQSSADFASKVLATIAVLAIAIMSVHELFFESKQGSYGDDEKLVDEGEEKKYYIADESGNPLTTELVSFDQATKLVTNYNAINKDRGKRVQVAVSVKPDPILYNCEDPFKEESNEQ